MGDKRKYGKAPDLSHEALAAAFAGIAYVRAVAMFGSRARKKAHQKSDYDFAVIFDGSPSSPWGFEAQLREDLHARLGISDIDYDIVDLDRSDTAIRASIHEGYVVLKGDGDKIRRILGQN